MALNGQKRSVRSPRSVGQKGTRMNQAHRFMRRRHCNPNDTAETLRMFLRSDPGVISVGEVEPHRKVGFRAVFDLDHGYLDSFIAELERNDCMSVM